MAKRVEFKKFLVAEVDRQEMLEVFCGYGVCDWCGKPMQKGYYIAVLNSIYCPGCFERWKKSALWHSSDAEIGRRNFELYAIQLGL